MDFEIDPKKRELIVLSSCSAIHPSVLAQVDVVDLSPSSDQIQELMLTQLLQSECKVLLIQHLRMQNDKQLLQKKLVTEEVSQAGVDRTTVFLSLLQVIGSLIKCWHHSRLYPFFLSLSFGNVELSQFLLERANCTITHSDLDNGTIKFALFPISEFGLAVTPNQTN